MLQKTNIPIPFSSGLDLKTDDKQVSLGKFLDLQNSVFDKGGLLQKRNGNKMLASLPDSSSTFLSTFSGNLTAIGTALNAYIEGSNTWVNKGSIQPALLDTLTLVRSSINQSQADSCISTNGLACTVYTDNVPSGGSTTPSYKYVVADASTGQNIIEPTVITPPSGAVSGFARVFQIGNYFAIVFPVTITGTTHLQYFAVNIFSPATATSIQNITSQVALTGNGLNWDGFVANNNLYLAWNGSDVSVRVTYLDSILTQHNTVIFAGEIADVMTVTADITGPTAVVWVTYANSAVDNIKTIALSQTMITVLAPTQVDIKGGAPTGVYKQLASSAQNGSVTIFYQLLNNYSYDSSIRSDLIAKRSCTQAGVVSAQVTVRRSVGIASKSFLLNGNIYLLSAYSSSTQLTYFLLDSNGVIIGKLAYSNGGGYVLFGLPSVSLYGTVASMAYLVKDTVIPVNKDQNMSQNNPIYAQTGVNLASFTIGTSDISVAEIGGNLNISGAALWAYDGYSIVEQGFHLWPDSIELTGSTSGGVMTAQQYFYAVTYEWSDNQGNLFRSAPSIPKTVTTTGSTSSVTVNVPTLRLTAKTQNAVKLVVYRWSTAQQTYYEVTSIAAPLLNSVTVDSLQFVDTKSDGQIIGNAILYTTGGVVENIGPPAASSLTLFKARLFLVDAEDKNLLWYSKQVIEGTPVEMSDLFTIYVAPTAAAQGPTGPITAISAMDDKLIIFKKNAIYYIVGNGPDITGANNDFSDPVFITSTVGCINQRSIVFSPQGLMFQSSKGIWLLDRSLATKYIGADVQDFNGNEVFSAINVPEENQVRFTLSNGVTLMYDYFYGQWGTFTGIPAVASTIYKDLHAFINSRGDAFEETPGIYLDGTRPVLMSFKTSWINLAGVQGFERAYFFYMIGEYISPHLLNMSIAYDYAPNPSQSVLVTPENVSSVYGGSPFYGTDSYGGTGSLEQVRVFMERQKCQAFQIQLQEVFDSSQGFPAGAGFTLSGLDVSVGIKDSKPRVKAAVSFG